MRELIRESDGHACPQAVGPESTGRSEGRQVALFGMMMDRDGS